jgi:SAM-dependent methyltransferase
MDAGAAEGYVTELGYTLGYYSELDPRHVCQRLRQLGFQPPVIRRACEPGFGQGLSLAIHAVAGDVEWWGNDLLPQHLATVRELAGGLTDRLHAYGEPFADFCSRVDLPVFDFIAMHGVWSWISPTNRTRLIEFIDRRLAPRGVLYLSYNLREAWAPVLPLREFLVTHAARPEVANLPLAERIEAALKAAQAVVAGDLPPARDDPAFERHLRAIRHQSKPYLAHEYFNRDWQVFATEEIAESLLGTGLQYAGQAGASAPPEERIRFRRDLWVRGLTRLVSAGDASPDDTACDTRLPASPHLPSFDVVWQFNDRLLQRARRDPYLSTLASPVTGAGVELGWRTLLALSAWRAGARSEAAIGADIQAVLQALGHPFVHRDVVIRDPVEVHAMLQREVREFIEQTLPRLRALGIEAV